LIKSACSPNVHQRSGGGDADHTEMKLRPCVTGIVSAAEGITNPPIDELLDRTGSKYALVIVAAKRARQINAYYSQLGEGLLEYVGPLVETTPQEKPLSIAMREINAGLLTAEPTDQP
jgi:DNA-directed RNA polymerase subunit omega